MKKGRKEQRKEGEGSNKGKKEQRKKGRKE